MVTLCPKYLIIFPNLQYSEIEKPDYSKHSYFSYKYNNFNQERFITDYTTINPTFLCDDNVDLNAKFDTFLLNVN